MKDGETVYQCSKCYSMRNVMGCPGCAHARQLADVSDSAPKRDMSAQYVSDEAAALAFLKSIYGVAQSQELDDPDGVATFLAGCRHAREAEVRGEDELDCGDNSCYFKKTSGGMRTNGGCRCFDKAGFRTRSPASAAIQMLPELLRLRSEAAQSQAREGELTEERDRYREALEEVWKKAAGPDEGYLHGCECRSRVKAFSDAALKGRE